MAAAVLKGRKVQKGVMLKIVPATRRVYEELLAKGHPPRPLRSGRDRRQPRLRRLRRGPCRPDGQGRGASQHGEPQFPGKQGKGPIYLACPAVVAASCVWANRRPGGSLTCKTTSSAAASGSSPDPREAHRGHRHRPDLSQRPSPHHRDRRDGPVRARQSRGLERFRRQKAQPGDIMAAGRNFGAGSSRQQAVDCFIALRWGPSSRRRSARSISGTP